MFTNKIDEFVPLKYWRQQDTDILIFKDYLINIEGKVYSTKRNKYLKPYKVVNGYVGISLTSDTIKKELSEYVNKETCKTFLLHKAVACTFLENPDRKKYTCVDHIDKDRSHYHANNLEWVTHSENSRRRYMNLNPNQLYLFKDEKR